MADKKSRPGEEPGLKVPSTDCGWEDDTRPPIAMRFIWCREKLHPESVPGEVATMSQATAAHATRLARAVAKGVEIEYQDTLVEAIRTGILNGYHVRPPTALTPLAWTSSSNGGPRVSVEIKHPIRTGVDNITRSMAAGIGADGLRKWITDGVNSTSSEASDE